MSKFRARFESRGDRSILDKADTGQLDVFVGANANAWRVGNVGWNWDTWNERLVALLLEGIWYSIGSPTLWKFSWRGTLDSLGCDSKEF